MMHQIHDQIDSDSVEGNFQGMSPLKFAISFTPLVMSLARRYVGRGAGYDDLVEDGYVALLKLGYQCPEDDPLGRFLSRRLPGMVRDAAARYRRTMVELSIDEAKERGIEPRDPMDLEDYISRDLFLYGLPIRREDFLLAQDILSGMTQEEIAKDLGIAQQTVSYRLKKLRDQLSKLFNHDDHLDDEGAGEPVNPE